MSKLITAALCLSAIAAGYSLVPSAMPAAITAGAEDAVLSYENFEYEADDTNVKILKYTGSDTEVLIPAQIEGKTVASVAGGAFYGAADIKSVTFEAAETVPEPGSVGFVAEGVRAEGLKIICKYGSAAASYALENGFETQISDTADIRNASISLDKTEFIYDGSEKCPSVKVSLGDTELVKDTDYTLSFSSNINAGQASLVITGKGRFTGSVTKIFNIKKAEIGSGSVTLSASSFSYTGKALTPAVTVKAGGKTLLRNTDYTLSYSNNSAVGTASVTVNGIGNYSGSVKKSFSIKLANVSGITSSSADETSVSLKWNKVTGATGYRVYIVDTKTGKLTKKGDVKKTELTVKGLSTGTKYKFAIKAYRVQGNATYLSPSYSYNTLSTAPAKVAFTVKTTEKGKAKLTWTKVKGATSYAVFYKQNKSDKWTRLATLSSSTKTYTVTGLSGSKGGYVTVKAYIKCAGVSNGGKFTTTPVYKYQRAAAKLDACGWDLKKACYAAAVPWIGAGLPRSGSVTMEWYADYGFTHGYGHCYCMAAMFAEMAKTMGYNCKQVYGAVGTSVHSWTELTLNGVTYICDPDFITETGRNGYCIIYGTSGTWRYTKHGYVATNG